MGYTLRRGNDMYVFREVTGSFIEGFSEAPINKLANGASRANGLPGAVRAGAGSRGRRLIHRLCGELGWTVDEQKGDMIKLHFKDTLASRRKVVIDTGTKAVVRLTVFSFSVFPVMAVP